MEKKGLVMNAEKYSSQNIFHLNRFTCVCGVMKKGIIGNCILSGKD